MSDTTLAAAAVGATAAAVVGDAYLLLGVPDAVWLASAAGATIFMVSADEITWIDRAIMAAAGVIGAAFTTMLVVESWGLPAKVAPGIAFAIGVVIVIVARRALEGARTANLWDALLKLWPWGSRRD